MAFTRLRTREETLNQHLIELDLVKDSRDKTEFVRFNLHHRACQSKTRRVIGIQNSGATASPCDVMVIVIALIAQSSQVVCVCVGEGGGSVFTV